MALDLEVFHLIGMDNILTLMQKLKEIGLTQVLQMI